MMTACVTWRHQADGWCDRAASDCDFNGWAAYSVLELSTIPNRAAALRSLSDTLHAKSAEGTT